MHSSRIMPSSRSSIDGPTHLKSSQISRFDALEWLSDAEKAELSTLLTAEECQKRQMSPSNAWIKWAFERTHVLLQAAPLAGIVVAGRYWNLTQYKIQSPVDATALPPLVAAASFIMGSVLSNVIADFKESEKVPAELLGYFQCLLSFAFSACSLHREHGEVDPKPALQQLEIMLLCIMGSIDEDDPRASFNSVLPVFERAYQQYCASLPDHVWEEMETPQHSHAEMVKKWARINDISRNSIVLPGYMLMDIITGLMTGLLVSVHYKDLSETSGYWACGIFSAIIIYLNLLVRQLDDPFEWPKKYWLHSYLAGGPVNFSLSEASKYVCNVDLESLVSGRTYAFSPPSSTI